MKQTFGLSIILLFILTLNSCSLYWEPEAKRIAVRPEKLTPEIVVEDTKNSYNLKRLERGMTKNDVYRTMGMPDLYADYQTDAGEFISIFYYYTKTALDDGAAAKNECEPIILKNEKVVGWGKAFYAKMKKPAYMKP